MSSLIVWEKWIDPFLGSDEDNYTVDSSIEPSFSSDEDEEIDDLDDLETNHSSREVKQVRVVATPMGIIPINEYTASSKIFNFWIGHTNFNISKKIVQIIEDTAGVETLDIFTRYRFRIGIGKVFKDSDVMAEINNNVYEYLG